MSYYRTYRIDVGRMSSCSIRPTRDHPIAWNPLEIKGPIALITSAFERAIKDAAGYAKASTPVMSLYIRNSLYALIAAGEPLIGLPFLLTSSGYRERVLSQVNDPLVKRFWRDFEKLTDRDKRQEVASTYNKAYALILDTRIRNVLGQAKAAFPCSDVLSGKILLARLPQGRLGFEQVRVLGLLLLSQLHLQALGGTRRGPSPCLSGRGPYVRRRHADRDAVRHPQAGRIHHPGASEPGAAVAGAESGGPRQLRPRNTSFGCRWPMPKN